MIQPEMDVVLRSLNNFSYLVTGGFWSPHILYPKWKTNTTNRGLIQIDKTLELYCSGKRKQEQSERRPLMVYGKKL